MCAHVGRLFSEARNRQKSKVQTNPISAQAQDLSQHKEAQQFQVLTNPKSAQSKVVQNLPKPQQPSGLSTEAIILIVVCSVIGVIFPSYVDVNH